jgi:diguanylate cyclase (GGDEF)-like protein/PAS domain S-box-containing protein
MSNVVTNKLISNVALNILKELDEGVYVVDRDRIIKFWNKGAERISGFVADEVLGKSCADNILNHIDGEGNGLCGDLCPLRHVVETGEETTAFVFLHHKAGHRIPIKVKAIPFFDQGEIVGVVEIFSDTSEVYRARRKIDILQKELYRDPLTGVGNRRFCDLEFKNRFDDFINKGDAFSIAICDIDDFKRINDSYGHDWGDRTLIMTARTLSETLRSMDVIGRWGGEEFFLIIPVVDGETLWDITERTRHLVEDSFLMIEKEKVGVTISIGATSVRKGDTEESLFKRADELLFKSKREGKNKVSLG